MAVHFLLGGVYLVILPLWGAVPDEPLHYSCIKYDAELLRQPTITDPRPWGEPLAVYCFTADPCGTGGHGPLYYWLSVPLFRLTRGLTVLQQLYVLRLWTLLLSSLMIPLAWAMLRRLFGAEPELVVAGTFLVALVPHRLMLSAVVYNDIACATGTFAYLWLLQRAAGDEGDRRGWFLAGCALGLAFLGKRVALVTVPGTLVAWYLQRRRLDWTAGRAWLALGAWALGFALVGGWWIARDMMLYGTPLPTEPGFHRLHQGWLEQWYGLGPTTFLWKLGFIIRGLWLSLWSQVGWVPWDADGGWRAVALSLYGLLALATVIAIIGTLGGIRGRWRGLSVEARDTLLSHAVMVAGMVAGAVQWVMLYSLHNHEETGKHAQSVLICVVALTIATWRWLAGAKAVRALWFGALLLLAFNLASIVRLETYLIPTWKPPTPALGQERVKDLPTGVAPGIWHRYRVPGAVQRVGYVPLPTGPEDAWHGG